MEVCHEHRCEIITLGNNFISCTDYEIKDVEKAIVLFDDMGVARNFRKVDDMVLSPEQFDVLYSDPGSRKNGYGIATRLWNEATVPYQLDNDYSNKLIMFKKNM